MTLVALGTILVVLGAQFYLPPLPSKLPSLQQIWKNSYASSARTDLKKLVITDQTVSTGDFTFYYPSGYIKDDATSVKEEKIHTQLLARCLEPGNEMKKRSYGNSITLEKILEPIDISSEETCKLLAEDTYAGTVSHQFNKKEKITICIIEFQYSSRESTYESVIKEYFYKKEHGDAYKITIASDTDSSSQSAISLQEAAEKFEIKN